MRNAAHLELQFCATEESHGADGGEIPGMRKDADRRGKQDEAEDQQDAKDVKRGVRIQFAEHGFSPWGSGSKSQKMNESR